MPAQNTDKLHYRRLGWSRVNDELRNASAFSGAGRPGGSRQPLRPARVAFGVPSYEPRSVLSSRDERDQPDHNQRVGCPPTEESNHDERDHHPLVGRQTGSARDRERNRVRQRQHGYGQSDRYGGCASRNDGGAPGRHAGTRFRTRDSARTCRDDHRVRTRTMDTGSHQARRPPWYLTDEPAARRATPHGFRRVRFGLRAVRAVVASANAATSARSLGRPADCLFASRSGRAISATDTLPISATTRRS